MTAPKRSPRESLLLPILIPVVALVVIVAALFLFSRVLLNVSHTAATATALAVAAGIMVVGSIVATRKQVTGSAMFALFGGVLGVTMLAGGLALLVGQPEEEVEIPVLALAAPPGASVDGFDLDALTVPANVEFEIEFDNEEEGVQHNVDLSVGDPAAGGTPFTETTIITGPAVTTYLYEPLEPGEYVFFCVVHPTTMQGTLTAAEGAEPGGEGGGGGGGEGGGGQGAIAVVAKDVAFDTDTIELPADTASQIAFDNQDQAIQHNLAIYTDDSATEPLFVGEIVDGPGQVTYDVPPLPAGEYFFRCDVHPQMSGTVIVTEEAGGGGGSPPPSESPPPEEPPPGGTVSTMIAAKGSLFDTDELFFTADTPATLTFDNQDPDVPHNVSIYVDDTAAEPIFVSELFTGPATAEYEIPAMPAGTYFFRCDAHPTTMFGTVTVT